jgi:hypothetical protein
MEIIYGRVRHSATEPDVAVLRLCRIYLNFGYFEFSQYNIVWRHPKRGSPVSLSLPFEIHKKALKGDRVALLR